MNDYERAFDACEAAERETDTAVSLATDPDIEALLEEALDKIQSAKALANDRI